MQITGFDETSIEIDNMVYPPSLIIFPKQVLVWEVASVEDLCIDHFILLKYVHPRPTYVIVGLPNPALLPASIADYLRSNFDNFDCLELVPLALASSKPPASSTPWPTTISILLDFS